MSELSRRYSQLVSDEDIDEFLLHKQDVYNMPKEHAEQVYATAPKFVPNNPTFKQIQEVNIDERCTY